MPQRLENRFNLVMRIFSVENFDVQGYSRVEGEGSQKFLDKLSIKGANHRGKLADFTDKERSSAYVQAHKGKRLVHRQEESSVTSDAAFVAESFLQRRAECDSNVLDAVMSVDFQVARADNFQVELPVHREQVQHVIKKSDARINLGLARAVQIQLDFNFGLVRRPINFSDSQI